MTSPEIGYHLTALCCSRDIAHHLARLGSTVYLVRGSGCNIDFYGAIAIEVSELNLVHDGVRLMIQLFD